MGSPGILFAVKIVNKPSELEFKGRYIFRIDCHWFLRRSKPTRGLEKEGRKGPEEDVVSM